MLRKTMGIKVRSGIIDRIKDGFFNWCLCEKHHILWPEGNNWTRFGGMACEECSSGAKLLPKYSRCYFVNIEFCRDGTLKVCSKKNGTNN
jgi:hypothetical protein